MEEELRCFQSATVKPVLRPFTRKLGGSDNRSTHPLGSEGPRESVLSLGHGFSPEEGKCSNRTLFPGMASASHQRFASENLTGRKHRRPQK